MILQNCSKEFKNKFMGLRKRGKIPNFNLLVTEHKLSIIILRIYSIFGMMIENDNISKLVEGIKKKLMGLRKREKTPILVHFGGF